MTGIKELAGKPYRPSNGTEGAGFQEAWCNRCSKDESFRADPDSGNGCPIIAASMAFNIGEEGYPKEWTHDAEGYGICTAFELARTKADRAYLAWKVQRDAQAGEARRAETALAGSVHEHAVPEGDAP